MNWYKLKLRKWYFEVGRCAAFLMIYLVAADNVAWNETFEFDGYTIYVSDTMVNLSCMNFDLPCAIASPSGTVHVNKRFLNMSQAWQSGVLYHEIGHIELKHKSFGLITSVMRAFGCESTWKNEMEADLFAAKKGHGMAILKYFKGINEMYGMLDGTEIPEIRARQKNLEEFYEQNPNL